MSAAPRLTQSPANYFHLAPRRVRDLIIARTTTKPLTLPSLSAPLPPLPPPLSSLILRISSLLYFPFPFLPPADFENPQSCFLVKFICFLSLPPLRLSYQLSLVPCFFSHPTCIFLFPVLFRHQPFLPSLLLSLSNSPIPFLVFFSISALSLFRYSIPSYTFLPSSTFLPPSISSLGLPPLPLPSSHLVFPSFSAT